MKYQVFKSLSRRSIFAFVEQGHDENLPDPEEMKWVLFKDNVPVAPGLIGADPTAVRHDVENKGFYVTKAEIIIDVRVAEGDFS